MPQSAPCVHRGNSALTGTRYTEVAGHRLEGAYLPPLPIHPWGGGGGGGILRSENGWISGGGKSGGGGLYQGPRGGGQGLGRGEGDLREATVRKKFSFRRRSTRWSK